MKFLTLSSVTQRFSSPISFTILSMHSLKGMPDPTPSVLNAYPSMLMYSSSETATVGLRCIFSKKAKTARAFVSLVLRLINASSIGRCVLNLSGPPFLDFCILSIISIASSTRSSDVHKFFTMMAAIGSLIWVLKVVKYLATSSNSALKSDDDANVERRPARYLLFMLHPMTLRAVYISDAAFGFVMFAALPIAASRRFEFTLHSH
mmetsp:Transcript_8129/g.16410  ORF Transcript_8129/g.16410 Transcript_8129/m.16410 type:complete len:206 (-) Transcript_8129:693-1310(-)